MTEELNIFDKISEDEWLNPTIQDAPSERFEFATYRFACRKKVDFERGALLEVPEISINGQPFMRNGMKEGGRNIAYFLEVTGKKQNGEEYTWVDILFVNNNIKLTKEKVEALPSFFISKSQQERLDKDGFAYFSLWSNFYQVEIGKFSPEARAQIGMGKPFYAKTKIVNYAKRPQIDKATSEPALDDEGNQKYWYDSYRTSWELFETAEQLETAKKEYWSNSDGNVSFKYPDAWGDSVQDMLDWVKAEASKEGADLKAIAERVSLTPEHTEDYKKILAKQLGIPEPMVNL